MIEILPADAPIPEAVRLPQIRQINTNRCQHYALIKTRAGQLIDVPFSVMEDAFGVSDHGEIALRAIHAGGLRHA